jgi:thiamine-monophosphate kinase
VQFFSEQQIVPTSMIDISDGLASEILHLERNSGHGMVIYEEKIPIAADTGRVAEQFSLAPVTCALSGGEDYELLFTVGQSDYEKISANPSVSIIGYVDEPESSSRMVTRAGATIAITAQGWNAFS